MACNHVEAAGLRAPSPTQAVYREDCTQCFDSIDDPDGLDVCLTCFNGGCAGDRKHSALHYVLQSHPLVLNIKRTRKVIIRDEPPQKMSKLAISAETDEHRYDVKTTVRCLDCGVDVDPQQGNLAQVVDAVMKANTFSKQEEVKAWEQEITACEHVLTIPQDDARQIPSQDLGHCSLCDLHENLWLCLQCGNLGCGRAQFGGVGGHSHGLAHATSSGHAVAVKLGSITPEGTADVYCYHCDEERLDPDLGRHLAHWGIILAERQKTEKSLTEMQIDENLRWNFSMTSEDGKELKPLFGQGLTGLKNLGNSCYLASSFQCLFDLPQFADRYYQPTVDMPMVNNPAEDLETQLRKLADGLLSGRYSKPDSDVIASIDTPEVPHQKGLAPSMLKHLVGRGHAEFSSMRQQDAFEFLLHIFKLVSRSKHPSNSRDPTEAFRFTMEQRLQCLKCKRVRYRNDEQDNISVAVPMIQLPKAEKSSEGEEEPADEYQLVTLKACLDAFTAEEVVELTCGVCGNKDGFSKRSLFKTFPEVLMMNARRFKLINWVPTKIDVPVIVGDEPFLLDDYKSPGLQPGEEALPEDEQAEKKDAFVANPEALSMLEQMGFPLIRCQKALMATGNSDANAAMEWLFGHMEDPDIDAPIETASASAAAGGGAVDEGKISSLGEMGFSPPQARKALRETDGDMERAVEWLFSHPDDQGESAEDAAPQSAPKPPAGSDVLPAKFQLSSIVCHKGSSIHAGHYVAFVRKQIPDENEVGWVLFNDEKVVKATDVDDMKKFAYVYFFKRA